MRLPFGLDLKTALVTIAIIYFVLPFALRMWSNKTAGHANKAK
jgi:hypothetical protein